MTAAKSRARAKKGTKKSASKAATRKKTAAKKATKKSAKKTASRKRRSKATPRKSTEPQSEVSENPEQAPVSGVGKASAPPAARPVLDRIFSNGIGSKQTPGDHAQAEFAAWSADPEQNFRPVGPAMRGHVTRLLQAARKQVVGLPVSVSLPVCFLGGFALGWLAGGR